MKTQDDIFLQREGDAWFHRNEEWLVEFDVAGDPVLRLLEARGVIPGRVLEIGASNGARLDAMARRWKCAAVAVEPSAEAVRDGRERFPSVEFHQATADQLPIDHDGWFDLVILHYVLHWVGRARLLRAVAEIDRMLVDDGFLLIGDFLPYKPTRVPYHHLPDDEVFTYKQDYAAPFLASGLYRLVHMQAGSHDGSVGHDFSERDRMGMWLLRKSLEGHYSEV